MGLLYLYLILLAYYILLLTSFLIFY
jgi:hypothetical protein